MGGILVVLLIVSLGGGAADVYKRQGYFQEGTFLLPSESPARPVYRLYRPFRAVSYTHLDVYKRQGKRYVETGLKRICRVELRRKI